MADKTGESSSGDKRDRKGKQIMYSDDDKNDKKERETWDQNPASHPWLSSQDLSIFRLFSEFDDFSGFIKRQQQAFQDLNQINNPVQISQTGKEEDPESETKIGDYETYSTDSDADKEKLDPLEELILRLVIIDRNCLVIPYPLASDHFPPMMINPNAEKTLKLFDPLGCEWKMTLIYNSDAHAYIITNGWNLYVEHYHLNPLDWVLFYKPIPQEDTNRFYIQHQKNFGMPLFEMLIPRSNRLPIPRDVTRQYFNPSEALPSPNHLREYPLRLSDPLGSVWEMKYICFEEEKAYIVVQGWDKYVAHYGLSYYDIIRFFSHKLPGQNSFIILHEARNILDYFWPPLCLPDNFLCELNLTEPDVVFGRLKMPGVKLPFDFRDREMVKLTDENSKNWYVIIVYPRVSKEYMIIDGWEGFVKAHELEAGDVVIFYMPIDPDHGKHFLIKCEKKKQMMTDKEEGGSGLGKHVDGAEQGQGVSRKGKEIAK